MNIKSSVAVTCFLHGRAKDLSAPLYVRFVTLALKVVQQNEEGFVDVSI